MIMGGTKNFYHLVTVAISNLAGTKIREFRVRGAILSRPLNFGKLKKTDIMKVRLKWPDVYL